MLTVPAYRAHPIRNFFRNEGNRWRRHPASALLRLLCRLSVLITIFALLAIVIDLLVKGIPHLTPELFSLKYTTENQSMLPAIINTLLIALVALLVAIPIGVGGAIYLAEYAKRNSPLVRTIRFFIDKEREADNGLPADVKAEAARKAEERLKYMTFYSTTQHCLRGFLLQYFGEAAPQKCGNCSCCLAAEQEAQLQVEYARRRAAQSADRLEKPRRAKPAAAGSLSEADEKLLNALYAVRKRLAGKQNLPAFMVFNDATLREMAEKKPMSIDELLNISGVGEKKAARYGNAFLRVIEDAVGSRE